MPAVVARALFGLLMIGAAADQISIDYPGNVAAPLQSEISTSATIPADSRGIQYDQDPFYRIYRVTAYCDRGLTAAGVASGEGQCAAPADIPFGSRIYIPELDQTFIVTDRTAKRFRHNTVDLFIAERRDCIQFGRQYLECEITFPADKIRYGSPVLRIAPTLASR